MRSSYLVVAGALALLGGFLWLGRPAAVLPGPSLAPLAATADRPIRPLMPRKTPSIASLPDRGNLVAFDRTTAAQQRSAYTWHAVSLSEEHAIRAITTGEMTVDVPDGPPIHLKYVRHVEHPDGNWTWIGRPEGTKPGIEAIMTFGEKAVFGSIPYGDRPPLRVTTAASRTWLVDTDPALLATLDNAALRPRAPDMVLPPVSRVRHRAAAAGPDALRASSAQLMPAPAGVVSAANTVDVLLGYTSAFASRLGGQSQALTRLNYMVDVANQAYANSQVSAQVRLVGTVQVSYPDTTKNETALYELTGVDCSGTNCVEIAIPASLQPLHTARDKYGADLVSLVRNFDNDTQLGCGIAWLIGGGYALSGDPVEITQQDEYAGFSVVSDSNGTGSNSFPDNNAVCRDETLAHELGHNMGSAHDRTTAANTDDSNGDGNLLDPDEYGRYLYSFGYRTNSPGNFYTVMAYRELGSSQVQNRLFSNPQLSICGPLGAQVYPCGVSDQADNARSLRDTIPLIATFRNAVLRKARNDFDGDGKSDVYWRNTNSGFNAVWFMDGTTTRSQPYVHQEPNQAWTVAGAGDFNGDGRADVFWRNIFTGENYLHLMNGAMVLPTSGPLMQVPGTQWQLVAFGDFDADGRTDAYWRNTSTGLNAMWLMDGTTIRSVTYVHSEPDQSWRVAGTGDFNGDGYADVLWRNASTGQLWIHFMQATTILATSGNGGMVADHTWQIVAIADFNGDGKDDLYWRNGATGNNTIWQMDGRASLALYVSTEPDLEWKIANTGDYNGDGKADVFWRHMGNGRNYMHLMSANAILAGSRELTAVSLDWKITGR